MARKKDAGHGGHGWFVTFADLMGLLVAFFVMLVASSTQDNKKLQIIAGSMREARRSGMALPSKVTIAASPITTKKTSNVGSGAAPKIFSPTRRAR